MRRSKQELKTGTEKQKQSGVKCRAAFFLQYSKRCFNIQNSKWTAGKRGLADDRVDHPVEGLDFAYEFGVVDFCVGLKGNKCRVYFDAGFIRLSLDL